MQVVDPEELELMVDEVVQELPAAFRERIDNLRFAVEDRAAPEDLHRSSLGHGATLLGIYRGVPLTHRTSAYNFAAPDLIVIFREPLQRLAGDRSHLRALVSRTVKHEIAHYFGISDARLRELGAY